MSRSPITTVAEFEGPPQVDRDGEQSWIVRGANFAVRVTRAKKGCRLVRQDNEDEYFVLLVDAGARFSAGRQTLDAGKDTLVIAPPGASEVVALDDGLIVTVFSSKAEDILALASNADDYPSQSALGPLEPWPMPVGGYRLRAYRLDDYSRPDTLMRLFRTQTLMLNVFRPREAPRDVRALSPHSHPDFEQGSLCLLGTWSHYLRYPWTPDMTTWRADEEVKVGSPSLIVIPPQVIHTSRNTNEGGSRLVDIFAGPRADFSKRPGLVCNADEYPLPPELEAAPAVSQAE